MIPEAGRNWKASWRRGHLSEEGGERAARVRVQGWVGWQVCAVGGQKLHRPRSNLSVPAHDLLPSLQQDGCEARAAGQKHRACRGEVGRAGSSRGRTSRGHREHCPQARGRGPRQSGWKIRAGTDTSDPQEEVRSHGSGRSPRGRRAGTPGDKAGPASQGGARSGAPGSGHRALPSPISSVFLSLGERRPETRCPGARAASGRGAPFTEGLQPSSARQEGASWSLGRNRGSWSPGGDANPKAAPQATRWREEKQHMEHQPLPHGSAACHPCFLSAPWGALRGR